MAAGHDRNISQAREEMRAYVVYGVRYFTRHAINDQVRDDLTIDMRHWVKRWTLKGYNRLLHGGNYHYSK